MRWLAVVSLAACGGASAPSAPIANRVPARSEAPPCEDTIVRHPPVIDAGLVIDDATLYRRVLHDHRFALVQCYQDRLRDEPGLGGRVTLELTIGPDGEATRIHTIGFDARMDRCLCEKIAAIDFGSVANREVNLSYPLLFRAP